MIVSQLMQILPGMLLLGLVIFVHELGHFLMAKWRGVRVIRFSLGFGPRMAGFTRGETEYCLSWIPLGGYVQMAGDNPDPDRTTPGGPEEFLTHPWFGRILIAVAGPAANLITAFVVYVIVGLIGVTFPDYPNVLGALPDTSVAYRAGLREGDRIVSLAGQPTGSWVEVFMRNSAVPQREPVVFSVQRGGLTLPFSLSPDQREPLFSSIRRPPDPPVIGAISTGMPAYNAGLKEGDRILSVGGRPITVWNDLPLAFRGAVDRKVELKVERDGRQFQVVVTPMDPEGKGRENGRIGIEPPRQGTYVKRSSLREALLAGAQGTLSTVGSVYAGMWLTVSRPLYYRKYVGGPMFIAQAAAQAARRGMDWYLQFMALINIAIMAFNLLPLPVLDGGHILLAVIEALRRRALSAQAQIRFQQLGLAVLGTLLVLILANDPMRLVQRHRAIDRQLTPVERPVAPVRP